MLSVVMPYWQRQKVLNQNLEQYRRLYADLDIEIVIVDDGSPEPAEIANDYPWPVRIVRLPGKALALNPCSAFNRGVTESSGYIVILTNPEVVHRVPVLAGLRDELLSLGTKGYAAAACWGAGWWYCHSTGMPPAQSVGRAEMPEGAGLHFCSAIRRSLYNEIGGFSEDYRDGQGYDDNDLLWKLHKAGARFKICDDLITDHHECPRSKWPAGGAERNRKIFESKWPNVRSG